MSKHEINKKARQSMEAVGQEAGIQYVMDRADILRHADSLLKELKIVDYGTEDILAVGEFLADI